MYVFLFRFILLIIINGLCTMVLTSSSNNRIVRNLKRIVDTALQRDTSDDLHNDRLIEQLSEILEQEEGFRIVDRKRREIYPNNADEASIFDGSGDLFDDDLPPFYSNMSIVAFTMVRSFLV